MVRFRNKAAKIYFIALLAILPFLVLPVVYYISERLSRTDRVNANVLIVEGWLPSYLLKAVCDEIQNNDYSYIVTTGMKNSNEYLNIAENGYLIFYTKYKLASDIQTGKHLVSIDAYSQLGGEHSAHFNLWINDTIIASFSAGKKKELYSVLWDRPLSDIDSVMVQFTNDGVGEFGDKNLYVRSVIFDNGKEIPFLFNSVYDVGRLDNKRRGNNDVSSNAEGTSRALVSMGIDSNLVFSVPAEKVRINRTLSSAVAFRDWLKSSGNNTTGINIISSGTHSLRTWLTFRKILDKSVNVGIISLPDYYNQSSRKRKILKTFWESISLVYYWIILVPY